MKYIRIYAGDDGETHMEDVEVELSPVDFAPPAPPMNWSERMPSSAIHFLGVPGGWYGKAHHAPRRQFVMFLTGEAEATTSDGETRHCLPGTVFLVEDTTGKGHELRALGNDYLLLAVVRLED